MVKKLYSCAQKGLETVLVTVEVEAKMGLPKFEIVGLAQEAIREGKKRVLSALESFGVEWKKNVLVNLSPAALKKEGSHFDLAIAMGLLSAGGYLQRSLGRVMAVGELSLDGQVQRVSGLIGMMDLAKKQKMDVVIYPKINPALIANMGQTVCVGIENIQELLHFLNEGVIPAQRTFKQPSNQEKKVDWADVSGQALAKRGLEIAAAGGHHALMLGPPGVGKTFLAKRFVNILPGLNERDQIEVKKIHSFFDSDGDTPLTDAPPFREPHHHATLAGMVGGGKPFRPGEFSLANKGVLFMDEMAEFRRDVLEVLREPLECGYTTVVRAEGTFKIPAKFMLLGATNLCACGALGDSARVCRCSDAQTQKYHRKISAPILDRLDLVVHMIKPRWAEVATHQVNENSSAVRERVVRARQKQLQRQGEVNAKVPGKTLREMALQNTQVSFHLQEMMEKKGWSVRAFEKVLRVARTLADLEGANETEMHHIKEAIQFRRLPFEV